MGNQLWSWALAAVGILGIWLAGRKNAAGWLVGVGAQFLWLAYAIVTRQWGFLVTAVAYAVVYGRNWLKWRREVSTDGSRALQAQPPRSPQVARR